MVKGVAELMSLLDVPVLKAFSGQEGLHLYEKHQQEIGLVLLDFSMPDMGGEETLSKLREVNPAVQVIFASGHDAEDVAKKHQVRYLPKPFGLMQLGELAYQYLRE